MIYFNCKHIHLTLTTMGAYRKDQSSRVYICDACKDLLTVGPYVAPKPYPPVPVAAEESAK